MTVPIAQPHAFHIGLVVRDLDAGMRRFEQLLGEMHWQRWELEMMALASDPETTAARLRVAYGRVPAQTIELIQVAEGVTVHSRFLRERGEGVQHLGVWVPDVAVAVERAVSLGGRITMAALRADGTAAVQLGSGGVEIVPALVPDGLAFVDAGTAGVQIEYVGPAPAARMRARFGDMFSQLISTPDWLNAAE